MSKSKKEWKVVDGYYPGFLEIVGASYKVSIVTSATDLTLEDYVSRTNDANLMAAAPDLLEALEQMIDEYGTAGDGWPRNNKVLRDARAAILKARGQQ